MVTRNQEGSALVVALLALLILLPITLILSAMVVKWQKQSADLRDLSGMEYVSRAGLADASRRLDAGHLDVPSGETRSFEVRGLGGYVARVVVHRDPDVVLTLDGRILEGVEARGVDLRETALDPDMRRVRRFRRLEVYLVEARVAARPALPEVKVSGILIRPEGGELQQVGLRIDRQYSNAPPGGR